MLDELANSHPNLNEEVVEVWEWAFNIINIVRQKSNISRTLVGNKIVDYSDVVGASPVGAAPTTSSFSTQHLASMGWAKTTARRYEIHLSFRIWCGLNLEIWREVSFETHAKTKDLHC